MTRFAFAFVAAALITAPALAGPCKDARGKFIKCPPAPAVAKGKDGKCRFASGPNKGKFTKCP